MKYVWLFMVAFAAIRCSDPRDAPDPIDRYALVNRHNIVLTQADTLGALTVGNGEFAFTVDVSGLQTFERDYERGIPLGTMSQWAWHLIPGPERYSLTDVNVSYPSCDSTAAPYPVQHSSGRAGEATNALRANPHRLHLGLIGLKLLKENNEPIHIDDLKNVHQELDLWKGSITSTYEIEGSPVSVVVFAHQNRDQVSVRIESPLIDKRRLAVELKFPYGKACHVCPGYDFDNEHKHVSEMPGAADGHAVVKRTLDSTTYYVHLDWANGKLSRKGPHDFELQPEHNRFEFAVLFSPNEVEQALPAFSETQKNNAESWKAFWSGGGAVDFSSCTDPRAAELERRVVLSQYLTKVQCSGSLPPQETGLTMNSWYGKFHMEMYWWHGAHFPLWGRKHLLEKSMRWYASVLPQAQETARLQGYRGARWQKMTDPYGRESPSSVGAFIIWQQPHPIYLAHLLQRADPENESIREHYSEIVFNTADFMASFLRKRDDRYHLCHPIIPAQEVFRATETDDPAFELQYWHFALTVAREWRAQMGMERNETWEEAITTLAPLPVRDGLYLPTSTTPDAYTNERYQKDHPAVLGALGFLPGNHRMDPAMMLETYSTINRNWDWASTWGWDYPLMAMTATRLHQPDLAIDALLMDTQKNTYLVNGHNYQDKRLTLYLPGNGGLLTAIALMTAGWDGNHTPDPGFPKNGRWNVRWEGIQPLP